MSSNMIPQAAPAESFGEIQDVVNRPRDLAQEGRRQARQRPLNQAVVIDSAELVDEQVGGVSQPAGGRDADAERLGILHEVRGERDDER
jgi:hypothetical protein